MRSLLTAAVSAALWSTAAFAAGPSAPEKARTEAPAARPAGAKDAAAPKAADAPAIPAGWSLVSPAEDGFRAAFPSSPKVDEKTLDTTGGKTRIRVYNVVLDGGGFLSVAVVRFPHAVVGSMDPESVLKSARDNMLTQQRFTLVSDKPVRVAGPKGSKRSFTGRDSEATGPQGLRVSFRGIVVEDRLYQLMFMRRSEKAELFQQLVSTFSLQ